MVLYSSSEMAAILSQPQYVDEIIKHQMMYLVIALNQNRNKKLGTLTPTEGFTWK